MAEVKWKPVQLTGNHRKSNKMVAGNYQSLSDSLIKRPEKRLDLLNTYDEMDTTSEITRALDIISEDISSSDVDDKKTFELNFPESTKPKKGQMTTLEGGIKNWEKITRLDYMFFDIVRETLKYGMVIFIKNPKPKNGEHRWKKVNARQIVGHKHVEEDENQITHYLIDFGKNTQRGTTKDITIVPVKDLFILKLGDAPYGKSILDNVYKVWKQQTLVENAVIIYRIVRAPERRVFFIDLGDMSGKRGEAELNRIKTQMYQKKLSRNGSLDSVYDPTNIQEDYFIGTNSEGRGNRIETLPGGSGLGEISDLLRFDKKLAMALRIPASYMDVGGDEKQAWNDGKVGLSLMQELRYVGYVRRLQRILAVPLFEDLKEYMGIVGIEIPEDLEFSISQTQNFSVYKENELNQVLLSAYNTAESIQSLSKRFALQKYLNLTDGELELNEQLKIEELGLEYAKLTKAQVFNVVYGDGSLIGVGASEEETGKTEPEPVMVTVKGNISK